MSARHVGFGLVAVAAGLALFVAGRASVSSEPAQVIDRGEPAVAEPGPAEPDLVSSNRLVALFVGPHGTCLPPKPLHIYDDRLTLRSARNTFTVREPGNGSDYGPLIATSSGTQVIDDCHIQATFLIPEGIRFFDVINESEDTRWGPFDETEVEANGWTMSLLSPSA